MPDTPQPATPSTALTRLRPQTMHAQGRDESPFSVMVGQVYEGPLDLLLDLIRKQDIDIYDIPIAKITAQYLNYVENMKSFDVDVAAEFIYTASLLIHIKSKMLLPRDPGGTVRRKKIRAGAGQPPARARALQDGGADAAAEATNRRERCGRIRR